MKLVETENAHKFHFLGGKISPDKIFPDLHAYAYAAVGPEIVAVHFDTAEEAKKAEERLKNINANEVAEIKTEKNVLKVWPKYLKGNPLETPNRKYKIAYKLLSALAILGELYYNDETGEIYVDEVTDAETVQKLIDSYEQRAYAVADEEREYVAILAVDYVTRKTED